MGIKITLEISVSFGGRAGVKALHRDAYWEAVPTHHDQVEARPGVLCDVVGVTYKTYGEVVVRLRSLNLEDIEGGPTAKQQLERLKSEGLWRER